MREGVVENPSASIITRVWFYHILLPILIPFLTMAIFAFRHVSVYDGTDVAAPCTVIFSASPGEIISSRFDGGDDPGESVHLDTVIEGTGCTLLPAPVDCFINTAAVDTDLQLFASFSISTVLDMYSTTSEIEAMRAASESAMVYRPI
jgi:hypothetical protein